MFYFCELLGGILELVTFGTVFELFFFRTRNTCRKELFQERVAGSSKIFG